MARIKDQSRSRPHTDSLQLKNTCHTQKISNQRKPALIAWLKKAIKKALKVALRLILPHRIRRLIRQNFYPRIGVLQHHPPRPMQIPKTYHQNTVLKEAPTISIVTPSFNQACYLERTIKSVTSQEYANLEYIIQDGGSQDGSVEIIKRHQAKLKHWQSGPDNGQSHALNQGFEHASGEIMAYLNSDDILLPGTLNVVAEYFAQHPDVDVIYGHRILIDEKDQEIGRWILPRHHASVLAWSDYIPQETLFWRRRLWEKTGGRIDENFHFAMDWELLLRFQNASARFARLPRFLGAFRIHSQQKTTSLITEIGKVEMQQLRHQCHGRDVTPNEIKRHLILYLLEHIALNKLYQAGILPY